MTTWKPGDVGVSASGERFIVSSKGGGCYWPGARLGDWADLSGYPKANDRPLVVIDPESAEDVLRLLRLYWGDTDDDVANYPEYIRDMKAALREFAAPTPPKPAEPTGLGAVVEDADGQLWLRDGRKAIDPWFRADKPGCSTFADIHPVRVLSEGVQ